MNISVRWCLTFAETIRFIMDGERGGEEVWGGGGGGRL